ncbi:MAG: MerR family DNA-binding transcriptional regulator, partial [Chloroflexi bacterium]|nr:MerR family DNA-binding transcriptional regulator [Chloroflexota bacterium]
MENLKIGDVAERAELAASTLRYYESAGLLPPPARSNGRRRYGEDVFRRLTAIKVARQYVPVREGRAFWQLTLAGSLRPLCLALGAKLCEAGVLEQVEDVFYLRQEETQEIARGLGKATWRELVQHRRSEREAWMRMEPPP